jgi:protoporphyrinogen oxidase
MEDYAVVIIGAGPAGLTAAYELVRRGIRPLVLEKADKVGGLARTEDYKGFHFDMGGHRFFTKVEDVKKMWHQVLGEDLLRRPRLSRIYYNRRFFYYPLKPLNALVGLGCWQSVLVVLSYLKWTILPYRREDTFEQWVTNRFGKRLFQIFFKAYTEKVWGIPCSELGAEWAAQRIKDLSLRTALLSMVMRPNRTITTLIEEFHYPRLGPGMMWNAVKVEIERRDGVVRLSCDVVEIHRAGNRIESVAISCGGQQEVIQGADFISSMPISEFIQKLSPPPPPEVVEAAKKLAYRDFLTVCLIVNKPDLFPDNWIYVHDPEVRVGRIQNFKNWSPDMVPDPAKTSLGLEYFCTEGDKVWNMPDADLVELGKREVDRIGLARYADIEDGCVFRVQKAYPVYDSCYRDYLAVIRKLVDNLENFQTIGRNGLHRYNNQDHAMLTGMLAVRNLGLGEQQDLWSVNTDQEYHEEGAIEAPDVAGVVQETLTHVFRKLDRVASGLAVGMAAGLSLLLATLWLVLTGSQVTSITLGLLGQYFPGYRVTLWGSVLGFAYGFLAGFISGWGFAFIRNAAVFLYLAIIHRRAEVYHLRRFLEYL